MPEHHEKRGARRIIELALALAAFVASTPAARAVELADGTLTINGFGRWAYGTTVAGGNNYVFATPGGKYDSGQFALSLTARPVDRLVVGAQVDIDPDQGGVSLDWAFAEYQLSDLLRIHGGRFKHAFGIFGETLKVGTLDPFLFLPKSIYGNPEFVVSGVEGIGISGTLYRGNWSLGYDAYFGAFETRVEGLAGLGYQEVGHQPIDEAPDTLGARLVLGTPIEGLSFRLSGYANLKKTKIRGKRWVVGASAEYVNDKLTLRSELFHHGDGTTDEFDTVKDAGYVEVAYFWTEHFQTAVRGELAKESISGSHASIPSNLTTLERHGEAALGLNWWFSPSIVVKLSGHYIHGNGFALPENLLPALTAGTFERDTVAVMSGVQFSF